MSSAEPFSRAPRSNPKYPLFFIVTRVKQPKRPLPELVVMISTSPSKNNIYIYKLSVVHLRRRFFFKGPRGCLKNIII